MARTDFRARIVAGTAAGLLVCAEGFRISFYLYLGARNAAAFPLRPTHGFRLEVFTAAGHCQFGDYRPDCGVEIVAPASCRQYFWRVARGTAAGGGGATKGCFVLHYILFYSV